MTYWMESGGDAALKLSGDNMHSESESAFAQKVPEIRLALNEALFGNVVGKGSLVTASEIINMFCCRIFLSILLCVVGNLVFSQGMDISFSHLTTKEGLPTNHVTSFLQD